MEPARYWPWPSWARRPGLLPACGRPTVRGALPPAASDRLAYRRQTPLFGRSFGLTVLFTLIAFTVSRFGYLIFPPRRLILLYAGVPALIAAATWVLVRPLPRRLAHSCIVATMAAWSLVSAAPATEWMRQGVQRTERLEAGVAALEAAGVKYCEAPFWTAYWVNLATLERITCAQYEHYPDQHYRPVVDRRRPRPYRAYVVYNDGADDDAWAGTCPPRSGDTRCSLSPPVGAAAGRR